MLIEKTAGPAKGRVGVFAVVLETGESVSLDENGQYPMQSVYKFPIAMAVAPAGGGRKLKLDQKVRVEKEEYVRKGMRSPLRDKNPNGADVTVQELIRLSIVESDGSASDVLMRLAGGAAAIQEYLTGITIGEVIVANPEKEIGQDWETQYRNWATPEGAAALLRALHEKRGISDPHQKLLLKFMTESVPGAKRLKGMLPPGTAVAHKTGHRHERRRRNRRDQRYRHHHPAKRQPPRHRRFCIRFPGGRGHPRGGDRRNSEGDVGYME